MSFFFVFFFSASFFFTFRSLSSSSSTDLDLALKSRRRFVFHQIVSMKGRSGGVINTAHGKRRTKAHEDEGVVVGSDLPDLAVYQILSLFPTRLAARTSILSKQWRRLWSSVPVIDLDEEEHPCDSKTQRSKCMIFVTSYLKLRERESCCIDKFRLRINEISWRSCYHK